MKKLRTIALICFTILFVGYLSQCADDDSMNIATDDVYYLKVYCDNGSVEIYPEQTIFNYGDRVQITATPNDGYYFCKWTNDVSSTNNPVTVTIRDDITIKANLSEVTYDSCSMSLSTTTYRNSDQEDMDNPENSEFSHGLIFLAENAYNSIPHAPELDTMNKLRSSDSVDMSDNFPTPGDQGSQESCVAWATAYGLKSYQEKIEETWHFTYSLCSSCYTEENHIFSPAFVYNQINDGIDGGAFITDALDLLINTGAGTWEDMPYDELDFISQPSTTALSNASAYTIDSYYTLDITDLSQIKNYLSSGYPVIIALYVYSNFYYPSDYYSDTGEYVWNTIRGIDPQGGHAMIIVGYDESYGFKVMNSWGDSWGNDGFIWIDFDLFTEIIMEAYVVYDSSNSISTDS